jgi:hypothetical protein
MSYSRTRSSKCLFTGTETQHPSIWLTSTREDGIARGYRRDDTTCLLGALFTYLLPHQRTISQKCYLGIITCAFLGWTWGLLSSASVCTPLLNDNVCTNIHEDDDRDEEHGRSYVRVTANDLAKAFEESHLERETPVHGTVTITHVPLPDELEISCVLLFTCEFGVRNSI